MKSVWWCKMFFSRAAFLAFSSSMMPKSLHNAEISPTNAATNRLFGLSRKSVASSLLFYMRRENVIQVDTVIQIQMLRHKTVFIPLHIVLNRSFTASEKNDHILAWVWRAGCVWERGVTVQTVMLFGPPTDLLSPFPRFFLRSCWKNQTTTCFHCWPTRR